MRHAPAPQRPGWRLNGAALLALLFFSAAPCGAQSKPAEPSGTPAGIQNLANNPQLMAEFEKLIGRLEHEVVFPAARNRSELLPLLPESTTFYAALPNYGDVAHQTLGIFQQEVQASPALREWWQKVESKSPGSRVEDSIEKFYQVSQYLGDEVVFSGTAGGHDEPKLLVIASIRKPGLKEALQQILRGVPASVRVRIVDPQELTADANATSTQQLLVLVRSDFVVASWDLATLRSFNATLDARAHGFESTAFGQRVAQTYDGGVTLVGAADLRTMLAQIPPQGRLALQRSGFADMKYFVWEHRNSNGLSVSNGELSFTGPRHGVASWLAAPGPMGGLDFASPKSMFVVSARLKSPAEMFNDVWEIAGATNPNAGAALSTFEQMFGINLKDDLLARLTGEVTIEVDAVAPKPMWKVILGVNDAAGLQQSLSKLFTATHMVTGQAEEGGTTYYTIVVPSGKTPTEMTYAYVPGYLILSSNHGAIRDALQFHQAGGSLRKSAKFLAALPPGHPAGVSALMYRDPLAALPQLGALYPATTESVLRLMGGGKPTVACAYGEESAIRTASTNASLDVGALMVGAAIVIPNLLRSKMAANDSAAVATLRSVLTAQMTYAANYPYRGYAPNLATLGRNPNGPSYTADYAALLDESVANPACTTGAWCTKSGFRFTLSGTCSGQKCSDFVAVGTPVAANTGTRSFCATSDGVIRFKTGAPLSSPVSASECHEWPAIR